MEDVRGGKEHLLGAENMGFWDALQRPNYERALAPCLAVGMRERCLEISIKYAKERVQFGRPIATRQAIQLKLARMYTILEHTRNMAWRLIWMREKKMD